MQTITPARNDTPGERRFARPKSDRDIWAHAQLENWGRWASGLPVELGYPGASSTAPTPIESDARRVESALLKAKKRRPQLYRFAFAYYVNRWNEAAICQKLKIRGHNYREIRTQLYSFLDGAF